MLHPGYSGYAAIDGFGVRAFATTHLPEATDPAAMLVRLVRRLLRQLRPKALVLGVPTRDEPSARELREIVFAHAAGVGVPVEARDLRVGLALIGLNRRVARRAALAEVLVRHFFPELAPEYTTALDRLWHRRPAWHALVLALHALVETHPRTAAAIARQSSRAIPSFWDAVGTSEFIHYPTYDSS